MQANEQKGGWQRKSPAALPVALCFSLLSILFSFSLPAREADSDEPARINARRIDIDDKRGAAIYQGDVRLSQGSRQINADRIEVYQRAGQLREMRAVGSPVRVRELPEGRDDMLEISAPQLEYRRQDERLLLAGGAVMTHAEYRAEATRIEYRADLEQAELTGNVVLRRGEDRFDAAHMRYDVKTRSLEAGPGPAGTEPRRVTAVLQPRRAPGPGNTP